MTKFELADLLEYRLFDCVLEGLNKNIINKEMLNTVIEQMFLEWHFDIINGAINNNLVEINYINSLILKNDNLTACFYMLKEMDYNAKIFENIEGLINKGKKNIHTFNMILNVLRVMILDNEISIENKDTLLKVYLKYSDYENIKILIDKITMSDIEDEYLANLLNNLKSYSTEMPLPKYYKEKMNSNKARVLQK